MKKTFCLVSVVIFLFGCASSPEKKAPVDDSLAKLHRAKEIQCSFTKGVEIYFTEEGEFEVDKNESVEDDEEMRLLFKIDPKSNNATTYYFEDADAEDPYLFASKMQRWERGISFIVYVEGWLIATITVFNIEDIPSDYGATFSMSEMESDPAVIIGWGSCKVIE